MDFWQKTTIWVVGDQGAYLFNRAEGLWKPFHLPPASCPDRLDALTSFSFASDQRVWNRNSP
jgi:hypothetical protein